MPILKNLGALFSEFTRDRAVIALSETKFGGIHHDAI